MRGALTTPLGQFAALAARWAGQMGLPAGNLWEPALVRYMLREVERLGGDASAAAFVEATTAIRLGEKVQS